MPRNSYGRQKIIDSLQRELDLIEKAWPMTANYQRIDPFITPYIQGGNYFELIIYHVESQSWFDAAHPDVILNQMSAANIIRPDEIAFDLGCNAGAVTVPMAAMCAQGGHVHAFDPYPWNAAATRHNAWLNNLDNVTAYAVGISNRDYEISVNPNDARVFEQDVSAGAQTLVIHDFRRYAHLGPTFLKLDIEGSEHDLFMDRDPGPFRSVEKFVLEFHPTWIRPRGIDPAGSLRNIEASGFDLHYHALSFPKFDIDTYQDHHVLLWGTRAT